MVSPRGVREQQGESPGQVGEGETHKGNKGLWGQIASPLLTLCQLLHKYQAMQVCMIMKWCHLKELMAPPDSDPEHIALPVNSESFLFLRTGKWAHSESLTAIATGCRNQAK